MSLAPLYAKAAAGALLPGRGSQLPTDEVVRDDVLVDRGHLADYARVCGFALSDTLPLTYPHVLGFALQVELMARRSFPLALPGLVHVHNRIVATRAIDAGELLRVAVHAERFVAHPKGAQVDLVTSVSAEGDAVWTARSTYLARGARPPAGAIAATADELPDLSDEPAAAVWRVAADTGRRYAAVSGDVNPIHLHPLSAKAFGFPTAIAHGMWTAARALASLQGRTGDAIAYDVEFRKPLRLPSQVSLRTRPVDGGWDLGVAGRVEHLRGTVRRSD
ncbi:MaoC family dehydratase [Pseudonocardia sulfidoxydans]|uniref:MaoC/PaaZ C-terminal domain-containing protein n=1 Tax=Pseudonocardia sulfidoxydans TaxID=54011 RepID=UPI0011BEA5F0|nr:MaoC/PaaZ C-terminal domain-containing protein [Pseudonocardia sulfidoxydans]